MNKDMQRFSSWMSVRSLLGKLGLQSVKHKLHDGDLRRSHIVDAAAYAIQACGKPNTILISPQTYRDMKKILDKEK